AGGRHRAPWVGELGPPVPRMRALDTGEFLEDLPPSARLRLGEPRVERRGVPLAGQQIPPALDARGIGRAGFGWLPCHRSRPRQVITAPPLPAPSATSRVPVPSVSSHERRDMLSVSWDT